MPHSKFIWTCGVHHPTLRSAEFACYKCLPQVYVTGLFHLAWSPQLPSILQPAWQCSFLFSLSHLWHIWNRGSVVLALRACASLARFTIASVCFCSRPHADKLVSRDGACSVRFVQLGCPWEIARYAQALCHKDLKATVWPGPPLRSPLKKDREFPNPPWPLLVPRCLQWLIACYPQPSHSPATCSYMACPRSGEHHSLGCWS